ncbi:PAS domain S-box protein [Deinococcus sp. SDU3-2]|uniref:histidine kinase n=1 Tax=Deinococcus terrestris TaxID=2651870 RepID=A0A7X1NTE4_9DEIO|nr:PAS domain S-box protein [Deinococcus terrestris]MPY65497.1 PAS domain S-box protein [Deinococcus terrestris]
MTGTRPLDRRWPLAAFTLVLLLSVVAAAFLYRFVQEQQRARFEREVNAHASLLRDRLNEYETLLRATRSFWLVEDEPGQPEYGTYVDSLDLRGRFPGVLAVGFTRWREGAGGRPQAVIERIAPADAVNREALGFDMLTEPCRRAAILRTQQTGRSQISCPVKLVQQGPDGQPLDGLVLFLPVGSGERFQGVVYLALDTVSLLRALQPEGALPGVAVETRLNGVRLGGERLAVPAAFERTVRQQQVGGVWSQTLRAPVSFGRDAAAIVPAVVLLAGMLVAGLTLYLMEAQVRARRRAEDALTSLARSRAQLQQSQAEFEAIFHAILDSAVFTDGEGRVLRVNRALEEQFGYAPAELRGEGLGKLHLDRRLEGRATFDLITTPYRRGDGSVFSGEAQRSAVVGPHGESLGFLEVIRDVTERVEAERARQAEERRSRAILDAIPHMLFVSDPVGAVTYVNAQHRERLHGAALEGQIHPEDRPAYARMWAEATREGIQAECEVRLLMGSGAEGRWFVVRVAPIRGEGGEVTEWVASATDIHDRLEAERRAQRDEARYRGVLEGVPQIVWLSDAGGQITYFNRRWPEYVGRERATEPFASLLHPEDRAEYLLRWREALRARRPFEAEHRLLGQGGLYRTFVTRALPLGDGGDSEWVGTSTDVDDQVYAEASARLLATVSEHLSARADDPLASRSENYRAALDLITGRLAESAGLWTAAPELRLLAASRLTPGQISAEIRRAIGEALGRVSGAERPLHLDAGSTPLLYEVGATGAVFYPLIGRDGAPRGVLALTYRQPPSDRDHDLAAELAQRFATALDNDALRLEAEEAHADLQTLNQSLEERVQQRTLELQDANRELEAFSYSVSHDLRTPLRHIVGFGDLLRKDASASGGLSPKSERYLGVITDAAGRMSRLIDDLLEFSRMGRQELRRGPVDLGAVVREAWKDLEPDRAGRDVVFEVGELPTVQGDAALLGQVFANLLSNALKYSRTRGQARITVSGVQGGGEVTVTVRDNGVGFDPRFADKLFGVFQRLHRAEEFEGTGIGLANVRRIVTRHGGRVRAESVPGEGAAFHVTLPLRGPDPAEAQP